MNEIPATDVLDVLVVGGGPVGGAAAALLAQSTQSGRAPLRIAVLEPRPATPASPTDPVDLRVFAYSRASERILRAAGAWEAIAAHRISPYERMRVWHESVAHTAREALVFDAAEAGEPNLGYIIETRLVQHALLRAAERAGARVIQTELAALSIGESLVHVETSSGVLKAKLVIGADGARSAVRASVGLTADVSDYGQTAIVANVATSRSHERTAWQRFLRTGTLAFLPLSDGTSSIVWSADDELAQKLLAASPEEFARELDAASDLALGETRLVSERASFPLRRLSAHHYVAQRCALIGDAAHVVHPLAGQGLNLGFQDACELARVLAGRGAQDDCGDYRLLRRYGRARREAVATMQWTTDGLQRLFAMRAFGAKWLRNTGLRFTNGVVPLKNLLIEHALA